MPKSLKQNHLEFWSYAPNSPSPSESLIIDILIRNKIPFMREVCFKGFKTPRGGFFRYDFMLLKNKVLIEYDGKEFHSTKEQKKNDRLKTKFCKDNNLKLIRIDKKSWHSLESVVLQCSRL